MENELVQGMRAETINVNQSSSNENSNFLNPESTDGGVWTAEEIDTFMEIEIGETVRHKGGVWTVEKKDDVKYAITLVRIVAGKEERDTVSLHDLSLELRDTA